MTTWKALNFEGYRGAIEANSATYMVSYSSLNGVPMSIYSSILTGFMKNELGFDGFLLSDYDENHKLGDNLPTSWVKLNYT